MATENPTGGNTRIQGALKNVGHRARDVRRQLQEAGTRVILIPERAPNANAYAERFVRSIKGDRHFRRAITEYVEHYHGERNHQGLDNRLISGPPVMHMIRVRCRPRLGGLLNFYERAA
jgi:putative transposase